MDRRQQPGGSSAGTRKVPFSRELWIERGGLHGGPPAKFFRLFPGREFGCGRVFHHLHFCRQGCRGRSGGSCAATYDPRPRGGDSPDGRRPRPLYTDLGRPRHARRVPAYDHLFVRPDPGAAGDLFADLNPDSEKVLTAASGADARRRAGWGNRSVRAARLLLARTRIPGRATRWFNRTLTLRTPGRSFRRRGRPDDRAPEGGRRDRLRAQIGSVAPFRVGNASLCRHRSDLADGSCDPDVTTQARRCWRSFSRRCERPGPRRGMSCGHGFPRQRGRRRRRGSAHGEVLWGDPAGSVVVIVARCWTRAGKSRSRPRRSSSSCGCARGRNAKAAAAWPGVAPARSRARAARPPTPSSCQILHGGSAWQDPRVAGRLRAARAPIRPRPIRRNRKSLHALFGI